MIDKITKPIWKFLYFGFSCGWSKDYWFPWALGPHPRWANRISEYLRAKWLEDSWDRKYRKKIKSQRQNGAPNKFFS